MNFRTRAMVFGGVIGAILGVVAGILYFNSNVAFDEEGTEQLDAPSPATSLKLGMGLLTGKFKSQDVKLPDDDIRHDWDFKQGRLADIIQVVEDLKDVLTSDGRTLAQGALGWLWARSEVTIPIPGFKSVKQVEENAGAMQFVPLGADAMREIGELLGRSE